MTSESWLLVPVQIGKLLSIRNHRQLTISVYHELDRRRSVHTLGRGVNAAILVFGRKRHCAVSC
jgi:hypothetical protein